MRERETDEQAQYPVIRFYTEQMDCFSACHITINPIPTGPFSCWWPAMPSLKALTGPWPMTGAHLLSGNIS